MHMSDSWSYCVSIHSCVAIPHCVGISSCVSTSVKREAVIKGLASEGLALILGSAEAGRSAVVRSMSTGPFLHRKNLREETSLWDNLLQRYLCPVSRLCRPANIGLTIIAPSRGVETLILTLLVHPPLQDPVQLGRDSRRTGHIVSALLFAHPFSTPNPGIYRVGGTVEWGEPPSLYPY